MRLYLDTSVLLPLHVTEPDSEKTTIWAADTTGTFVLGSLAVGEFYSGLSRLVRMKMITADAMQATMSDFFRWSRTACETADNTADDIQKAAHFVANPVPKLLMPDAIHIAACRRLDATLVTLDRDMAAAAQSLGIMVERPF